VAGEEIRLPGQRLHENFIALKESIALLLFSEIDAELRVNNTADHQSASHAFRDVYGKSERAVALDLRAYLRRRALPVSLPSMSRGKNEQNPAVQEIGLTGTELLLADLLASHQSSAAAARKRLGYAFKKLPAYG